MKLPTLKQLMENEEQWMVFDHPLSDPMFVVGPPGSGKTSLAVQRSIFLVNQGQTVMVVTRNRMLTALARRLGESSTFDTSTMHTFLGSDYGGRFHAKLPQTAPYRPDWDTVMDHYSDRGCAPAYQHLVVDEGQNLPARFYEWARSFGGHILTVFADEHQATSELTSSLSDISLNGNLGSPKRLTMNHRNTPEIAAVAEHFHKSIKLPPAIVRRPMTGELPRLIKTPSWNALADTVATRLLNRREAIGVIVHLKAHAKKLHTLLQARLQASDRVDWYTSDHKAGSENIAIFEPGITVITSESAIGLEFETTYLVDLARSLPCRAPQDSRRMYMLCARARTSLFLVDGLPDLGNAELAALPDATLLTR